MNYDSSYVISGWKPRCDTSKPVIDNHIRQINRSIFLGTKEPSQILFETPDFQLNVNYNNMVMAVCFRGIMMADLDFDQGYWSTVEAENTIEMIQEFCDFMHKKGEDLLFKIYRTQKGMHALLVNQFVDNRDERTISILTALCNDPFYTAYSVVKGTCIRIGPKVYRPTKRYISDYAKVNSEVVSKDYKDVKYIGYGTPIPEIIAIATMKTKLIKFIRQRYLANIQEMTKMRYIDYVDEFKKMSTT